MAKEEKPVKPQRTTPRFQDEDVVSRSLPDEMEYKRTERVSTDKKK